MKYSFKGLNSLFKKENPYWMFDVMADLEEKHGVRSTIFFLNESLSFSPLKPKEWKIALGRYSIREERIADRIKEFHRGGWEIGVHGSYNSYLNRELLVKEKSVLEEIIGDEIIGIRQHYLNMKEPETWIYQKEAGFKYDASLGKKRGIGYKDERSKPFTDESSGMFIIPLTFMESNLFAETNSNPDRAIREAIALMDGTEEKGGVYTVLWHQRMFNEEEFPGYYRVYDKIIREARGRNAEFLTCRQIYDRYKGIQGKR
jgi:peptidoglycan/xylan/chitin deacetylase (PgdA/CDA1 family)